MRISQTLIPTLREAPRDAEIVSHVLMLRAGMIRKLSNGLYSYLPFGLKALRKVENIIRGEMDQTGALEIKPTVVVPGELWKESGRWETFGDGMLRTKNRLGADLVISPTAEEVVTSLFRDELSSYRQLPVNLYQINTKYRDEVRPRYGVMRGREFTMKDAYSFHTDDKSLDVTYQAMGVAYRRVFKRCGLSVIAVKADTGAMGGTGSEEFMVESSVGDDTLLLCPSCDYRANMEKAACRPDPKGRNQTSEKPVVIDTPAIRTIAELTDFLKTTPDAFIKTLVYKAKNVGLDLSAAPGAKGLKRVVESESVSYYPEVLVAVLIRGDLDLNDAKLAACLKASEVELATDAEVQALTKAPVGFAGPVGLDAIVVSDLSVAELHDAYTGANAADKHLAHVEPSRDFQAFIEADLRVVKAGDLCPECGAALYEKKGNELGHIFKLGYKYTRSMNVHYLDENGKEQTPTMGCYGIGVDRTLASIIEEHHDENGIIWPMSVAPYQVILVPLAVQDAEQMQAAEKLYNELSGHFDVLMDDRDERPGVKFKDADLLGIPVRVTIGKSYQQEKKLEIKERDKADKELVDVDDAFRRVSEMIHEKMAQCRA